MIKKNKAVVLALETSCDETAGALISCKESRDNFEIEVLSNIVASQIEIHRKWGGVWPELASRAHLESIIPVLQETLAPLASSKYQVVSIKKVDAIAVTTSLGLIGSLLMGTLTVQTLSACYNLPIVPVNHLEGHIYAAFTAKVQSSKFKVQSKFKDCKIENSLSRFQDGIRGSSIVKQSGKIVPEGRAERENWKLKISKRGIFPLLALVVSGGHTSLILMDKHLNYKTVGQTIDDAAGEAFDKVARILGLGYPGGPEIEKLARKGGAPPTGVGDTYSNFGDTRRSILNGTRMNNSSGMSRAKAGNENAYELPLAMLGKESLDFSFSGLKTAVLYLTKNPVTNKLRKFDKADLAASFQKTVAKILTEKTIRAVRQYEPKTVILTGGVSANEYLRAHFEKEISRVTNAQILIPPKNLSTDNAVGIAIAGAIKFSKNKIVSWDKIETRANYTIDKITRENR